MKLTEEHKKTSNEIDYQLRQGPFQHIPLDEYGTKYAGWYARLLSALTVIVDGDNIAYAQTDYDSAAGTVRFLIYLADSLLVVDVAGITDDQDAVPTVTTRIFPRSSLESFEVNADLRIDVEGSREYAWPGALHIQAKYRDVGIIDLHASGYDPRQPDVAPPILSLIKTLRADLAG